MAYRSLLWASPYILWLLFSPVARATLQSTNFRIDSESINVGGVESQNSASFRLQETIGEQGTGGAASPNFQIQVGYRGFVGLVPSPTPAPAPTPAAGGAALPPGGGLAFNATVELVRVADRSALITWTGTKENIATLSYGLASTALNLKIDASDFALTHSFALTDLAPQTQYFFKISSTDRYGEKLESTVFSFTTEADLTPPANVQNFRAASGDRTLTLSWLNPPDADFAAVRIRRSTLGYPRTPFEGNPVYDGRDERFVDRDLQNGATYYYAAFSYDTTGNFASGALARGAPSLRPTAQPAVSPSPPPLTASPFPTPVPTPLPTPIGISPSPAPFASTEHAELTDFTFQIQTPFGYIPLPVSPGKELYFIVSQNVRISVPEKIFKKTVDEIVLSFNDNAYFLKFNERTDAYEVIITAPPTKGTGALSFLIKYADGREEELRANVAVDPYGYIYESVKGQELRLTGATVTLESCAADGTNCMRWPAEKFGQENPQKTGKTGEYYFLAKPGTYRLTAEKPGYRAEVRTLKTIAFIHEDIELRPLTWYDRLGVSAKTFFERVGQDLRTPAGIIPRVLWPEVFIIVLLGLFLLIVILR